MDVPNYRFVDVQSWQWISLTAHSVYRNFEMMHRNLETRHLPGVQDYSHLASAFHGTTSEWRIDLDHMSAFTTDNGSNIFKAVKKDLEVTHLPCTGHTLNLAVQSALKEPAISTALSHCKNVITHFNQSQNHKQTMKSYMLKAAAVGAAWTCIDTG